jgi:hypothetical protein
MSGQIAPPQRTPPDIDIDNVVALTRRRRGPGAQDPSQARVYKKARMRTRNWSQLRQRAQQQQFQLPGPVAPNVDLAAAPAAELEAEPELEPVPEHEPAYAQPTLPTVQDTPQLDGNSTASSATVLHNPAPSALPRDHLILLIPNI